MFPSVILPLTMAMGLAILVTTAHRRLPPVVAARVVTITLAVVAAAALPTLWILSLGYVARLPLLGGRLEWCAKAFGVHDPISSLLGVPAVALSIADDGTGDPDTLRLILRMAEAADSPEGPPSPVNTSGEQGIRTLGRLAPPLDFESSSFGHSDTFPRLGFIAKEAAL